MKKVDHIPHLEDLLFEMTPYEVSCIVQQMMTDFDSGEGYSIKYDGSPSLIMGEDPSDGKFFLATKSLFNRTPIYYKSFREIQEITKRPLREALTEVWETYHNMFFPYILQGDLMWTKGTLRPLGDGTGGMFKLNTLTYIIRKHRFPGVMESNVGMAWHTAYVGGSLSSLNADFTVDAQQVAPKSDKAVAVETRISADRRSRHVNPPVLGGYELERHDHGIALAKKYFSTGSLFNDSSDVVSGLLSFVCNHYDAEEEDRKSFNGKMRVRAFREDVIDWVQYNAPALARLYRDYKSLVFLKEQMLPHLNKGCPLEPYLGNLLLSKTEQEGFVYKHEKGLVKLVDRSVFTNANRLNSLNHKRNTP